MAAGLTGHELSRRCGWSDAKTSRIESAKTPPSAADIDAWCAACEEPAQAVDLIVASRHVDEMYASWQQLHQHGMRQAQEDVQHLYGTTRHFRIYCSNVLPGVLQTREYATALLATISSFQGTPDDSVSAAEARFARSFVLQDGHRSFAFLLEEAVLHHRQAPADVLVAQLHSVLDVMRRPNVSLGIVPSDAPRATSWPLESFYLFDDRRVSVELLTAAVNLTAPSEVAAYAKAFSAIAGTAVYGDRARNLISKALSTHE